MLEPAISLHDGWYGMGNNVEQEIPMKMKAIHKISVVVLSCAVLASGFASGSEFSDEDGDEFSVADGDCDDQNARVNPVAMELCSNQIDDDCDGAMDAEDDSIVLFGADADGDGYITEAAVFGGDENAMTIGTCSAIPDGYTQPNLDDGQLDCDDANASVNPGASESCNLVDDDCDDSVDEDVDYVFSRDADGDGFGSDTDQLTAACTEQPDGYTYAAGDCDDETIEVNPNHTEVCDDEIDNNCDGETDEDGCDEQQRDDDGDGVVDIEDTDVATGTETDEDVDTDSETDTDTDEEDVDGEEEQDDDAEQDIADDTTSTDTSEDTSEETPASSSADANSTSGSGGCSVAMNSSHGNSLMSLMALLPMIFGLMIRRNHQRL